jgi:hypothetical protein
MEGNKIWFIESLESLDEKIKNDGSVDGASFLSGYLNKNWPTDLDESVDDEEFESYVNENLDLYELWLKGEQEHILVGDDYDWSYKNVVTNININEEDLTGSNVDTTLADKSFDDLKGDDFWELCKQRDYIHQNGNIRKAERAALMAANLADKNQYIGAESRMRSWEVYGEIRDKLEERDAYTYYEKAGNIALSSGDTLNSANYFSNAARIYQGGNWKEEHRLLRKARVLFSDAGVNDKASKKYIEECNLKVKNETGFEKIKGHFYCVLSNYGESPWRVIGWITTVIAICALLYWSADINTPGIGIYECKKITESEISLVCEELSSGDAHPLTHLYFSFVTFTTLGYGDYSPTEDWARAIAAVQAMLGLILSSLFIATFLRKFSR